MKTIGYIQQTSDAVEMQRSIANLNDAGVSTDSILIESNLEEALLALTAGDRLYVGHLSELGESLPQVFSAIDAILERGATICSLTDDWVNNLIAERDFPYVIKALNALNSEIISKQTKKGLRKARRKGKRLGRPTIKQ